MTADADTQNPEGAAGENTAPPVTILAQYIKDLSFEAPSTPSVFSQLQNNAPDIKINVDVRANHLQENAYEVVLFANAQCVTGETTAFILELSYGGIFNINVSEENLRPLLLIECPRLLFPFARNIIADVSRDGGFPPLMLSPLDFVDMYRKGMGAQDSAAETNSDTGASGADDTPESTSTH